LESANALAVTARAPNPEEAPQLAETRVPDMEPGLKKLETAHDQDDADAAVLDAEEGSENELPPSCIIYYHYGFASEQGRRPTMEDEVCCISDLHYVVCVL
jgi:hypothetical protein